MEGLEFFTGRLGPALQTYSVPSQSMGMKIYPPVIRQKQSRSVFTDELESSDSCNPPQMASSTFTTSLLPSLTVQNPLALCKSHFRP